MEVGLNGSGIGYHGALDNKGVREEVAGGIVDFVAVIPI